VSLRWRPITTAERQLAWVWAGIVISVFALRPLWPIVAPLLRRCAFRELTGVPCPTCGGTRGALALLDGRVLDALAYNPLVMTSGIAFLIGGVLAPFWAWRIGKVPDLDRFLPMWSRIAIVILVFANWAYLVIVLPAQP
jgi:hypothetical protein